MGPKLVMPTADEVPCAASELGVFVPASPAINNNEKCIDPFPDFDIKKLDAASLDRIRKIGGIG